jgi:peptidoglycan/xylan/chitin deacetylase (PgdA/CDA1 family)
VTSRHGRRRRFAGTLATLAVFAALPATAAPPQRTIAVTLDDLPYVHAASLAEAQAGTRALLDALRGHHVPAIGFVNEDKLFVAGEVDGHIGLLEAWLEAGMELGNHNYGHVGFQATPRAQYQEAVLKGEVVTRWLLGRSGRAPRYYRHTYTQTGPSAADKAAFEAFLADHGYSVAPFTIEHDDFVFAAVHADARRRGDAATAARVREAYVAHLDPALDTFESMAEDLFGRPIPQVLLIHASPLNADSLEAMLTRLETRGYRFVSLQAALEDPAYASPDGYVGPHGPSWLLRWSLGLGKSTRQRGQPDPPAWITERYRLLR